eukprot:2568268-Amphidinium_carterae.1
MTVFRMVAERVHQLRRSFLHRRVAEQAGQVHLREQLGQAPSNYPVNSTLLVTPILDPTSVSTMTWSTSTRCTNDISMLTVPQQQPHRRELPTQQAGSTKRFYEYIQELGSRSTHLHVTGGWSCL